MIQEDSGRGEQEAVRSRPGGSNCEQFPARGKWGQKGVIARDMSPIARVLLRSVGGKPEAGSRASSEPLGKTSEGSRRFWTEGGSGSELSLAELTVDGCQGSG